MVCIKYRKFDEYLSGEFSDDYWYDEGCTIAMNLLERFEKDDWEGLINNLFSKSVDWQIRYAYCSGYGNDIETVLKSLFMLLSIDNNELFVTCVDTLRCLLDERNRRIINIDKSIIERVKLKLCHCGIATKGVLEDFLLKFE